MIPSGEYRAWRGQIDETMKSIHDTPKSFTAIKPVLALDPADSIFKEFGESYGTREWMTELALGFNESAIECEQSTWAVVFKRGEEPTEGQVVELRTLAGTN